MLRIDWCGHGGSAIAICLQARFQNTMAELESCAASTHDASAVEVAHRCHDPEFFEQRMLGIQSLLGLSRGDTIQLIRFGPWKAFCWHNQEPHCS